MHTTKTQVMWNQVGLKKNQYYWGYIFFSVLERCLNLSHVTTMQVLLWVSLRPYILLMIYSHYPFKSFFFHSKYYPILLWQLKMKHMFKIWKHYICNYFLKIDKTNHQCELFFFLHVRNSKTILMNNLCKFNRSFSLQNQWRYKYYVFSRLLFLIFFLRLISFFLYITIKHLFSISKFQISCKLSCKTEAIS